MTTFGKLKCAGVAVWLVLAPLAGAAATDMTNGAEVTRSSFSALQPSESRNSSPLPLIAGLVVSFTAVAAFGMLGRRSD